MLDISIKQRMYVDLWHAWYVEHGAIASSIEIGRLAGKSPSTAQSAINKAMIKNNCNTIHELLTKDKQIIGE